MKVTCLSCGKITSHPAEDAGLTALCTACGAKYRVPDVSEAETVPLLTLKEAAPASPPVSLAKPIHAKPLTESPRSNFISMLVAGSAGLLLLACIVFAWAVHDWRRASNAAALAGAKELEARAELLAASGHAGQAREQFAHLERMFNDHRPLPPDWAELADDVHRAEALIPRPPVAARNATKGPIATVPVPGVIDPTPLPASQTPAPTAASIELPLPAPASSPEPSPLLAPQTQPAGPGAVPLRPPIQPVAQAATGLTDEQIGKAITLGIDRLVNRFNNYNHVLRRGEAPDNLRAGVDILCVYALMQCEQATGDARLNPHGELMKGLIDAMKSRRLDGYQYETYSRGLRATALALYDRPEDRMTLRQDAGALLKGAHGGAFTYTLERGSPRDDATDNSNSQYGLLGVWSAAETGFEVPSNFWSLVQQHWTKAQIPGGQWSYSPIEGLDGTHSMTCAGIASLFVTHDYLDAPKFESAVGREPFTPALLSGLNWLERGDNCIALDHGAYDLYGLERVGLASGFKYFGQHEWYRELAAQVVAVQQADGSWGDDVETAYALLFLSRGRHPVIMNKLRFKGYWANRPRDVANLARFASHQLERPLNWQVVPADRPWTDWMDSPILYLASHQPPILPENEVANIRQFIENGGLLFMQADGDAPEFNRFARGLAHKLFPAYEMTDLPANHPLYNVMYKLGAMPELKMVTNGSRILILDSTIDISKVWQLRDDKNRPMPFQLGTNLFVYAAGKRDFNNRLTSTYIPKVDAEPIATYSIARLSYPGNWDPEPAAWERFSRWFALRTGYVLNVTTVAIKDLKPETAPIAHLTGTARYDLTNAESLAIKQYVEAGGVLLVDLCGGTGSFDQSLQSSLYFKVFAKTPARVMSPSHPLLSGADGNGMTDLSKPLLRQFATDQLGINAGLPEEISAGKGHVIYTSLDITSGLLGTNTWAILGYEPRYAQELVKNAILWTIDGAHEGAPLAQR